MSPHIFLYGLFRNLGSVWFLFPCMWSVPSLWNLLFGHFSLILLNVTAAHLSVGYFLSCLSVIPSLKPFIFLHSGKFGFVSSSSIPPSHLLSPLSQDMRPFFPNSSAPSSSPPPARPLPPLRATLDWHPTHQPAFQGSIPVFSSGHQKSGKSQPFQRPSLCQTLF